MVRTQTCQSGRYGVSVGGGPTICIGYLPWRLRSRNHPTCNSRASSPYPLTAASVRRECTARCHLRRSVSTWRHGAWHVCVPQGRSRSRQTMHCLPVGPTCSQPTVILFGKRVTSPAATGHSVPQYAQLRPAQGRRIRQTVVQRERLLLHRLSRFFSCSDSHHCEPQTADQSLKPCYAQNITRYQ